MGKIAKKLWKKAINIINNSIKINEQKKSSIFSTTYIFLIKLKYSFQIKSLKKEKTTPKCKETCGTYVPEIKDQPIDTDYGN
jgi:hypothetical protein